MAWTDGERCPLLLRKGQEELPVNYLLVALPKDGRRKSLHCWKASSAALLDTSQRQRPGGEEARVTAGVVIGYHRPVGTLLFAEQRQRTWSSLKILIRLYFCFVPFVHACPFLLTASKRSC